MKQTAILITVLLAAFSADAAQLYQWKDAQGRMVYSDQPPPPSVRNATQKSFKGSVIEVGEPYALKQAREKYPVTLYVTPCGLPCDQARQLLADRGVPYRAKNPETSPEDQTALLKLTGRVNVPVLLVGSDKIDGFESGEWNAALDRAGYPKSSGVPKKAEPAKDAASTPKTAAESPAPQAAAPSPAAPPK
jgi:glutaredoxin